MEFPSSRFNSRYLVLFVSLHSMFFMWVLTDIRDRMTNENQSAFEINGNGLLMILAIVALLALEVSFGILLFKTISPHRFPIFKFIAMFSASLASFLLGMVVLHSPKNDLTLYLLGYVIFAFQFAYACSGVDDAEIVKRFSFITIVACLGLVLVPLDLVLALFAPKSLDQIVFSVMRIFLGVEVLCVLSLFFKFLMLDDEKQEPEPENFDGYHVIKIQRGENNDWEARLVINP